MSTRKQKALPSTSQLTATFDAIIAIIVKVKATVSNLTLKDARSSLLDDLHQLATLGETFSGQRPKGKFPADLADTLDREGVHLWNTSALIRQGSEDNDDRSLFAAFRLAGFRLIEAGLEKSPSVETLINILQLASKSGAALSECGRNDAAASVLGCAAKFEEQLRNTNDESNDVHEQAKARAVTLYYCSRMITAWRDGNDAIAQFMLEKITESDERRLSLITITDREMLSSRILEIGKSVLKVSSRSIGEVAPGISDAKRAQNAVRWFQKAFALIEKVEDIAVPGIIELKRGILRGLARAYYLSSSIEAENLARAETTLQELVTSIDQSADNTNPEYHQLRWMLLAVLKKRKAPESTLQEAFASIIDHTVFNESEVTDILQELRTLAHEHKLVSTVLHHCIKQLLNGDGENTIYVDRFLLSLFSHCAKDQNHLNAMKHIEVACSYLADSEFELEKTPAMACLTVLWKVGDRHYQTKKWDKAADWFLAGTHKAFTKISQMSNPKCFRKAALCYIEQREYARASQVILRCPSNQASTSYLLFLTAVYQGLEDEAVVAIQNMTNASDFDRKMLLLATQLAHESDLKNVLLIALEALLKTLQGHGPMSSDVEAVLLIRCIIRLSIRLMKEAPTDEDRLQLVFSLIRHFKSALAVVQAASSGKSAPVIAKDLSWLWRTAYNVAVQGCSEWLHAEGQVADLFEICHELLQAYSHVAIAGVEADAFAHMVYASFSCVAARMFVLRQMCSSEIAGEEIVHLQDLITKNIQMVKSAIAQAKDRDAWNKDTSVGHFDRMLHAVCVFEVEICSQRQDWNGVLHVVQEMGNTSSSLASCEAIADVLWTTQECPVNVLYAALEALLHACVDGGTVSVEKFSRWLRAICTILLSRNSQSDRTKAVSYIEQALTVMGEQNDSELHGEVYPVDERQWLLSTTYNTGVECLATSFLDEAKRWFEAATVICRFVPGGKQHSEKISETYRKLLEQYTP